MSDPRHIASRLLGAVDWQTEVSGFCRCPGESLHTTSTGKKDCRVNVDGAPTIYCFHASCATAVAEANLRLRRELGAVSWELKLPNGQTLKSGDILRGDGSVMKRPEVTHATNGTDGEALVLETLKIVAERFKPEL